PSSLLHERADCRPGSMSLRSPPVPPTIAGEPDVRGAARSPAHWGGSLTDRWHRPYNALRLLSEIGTDMTRWPPEKHFTSCLALSRGGDADASGGNADEDHPNIPQGGTAEARRCSSSIKEAVQTSARRS